MYSETFLRVIRYDTRHHLPFEHAPGKRMVEFRQHIRDLSREFEMASMQSALDFLDGSYHPRRNQCLLTFDCGWREHYTDATPILSELRISGVFSVITSCLEERTLPVSHMREYLLETLGFDEFASDFFRKVVSSRPDAFAPLNIDIAGAAELYPTELPEVGRFKYLLEFGMDHELRDRAVRSMFADRIGDGATLADSLYIGWEEARSMQAEGMVIGGHAHRHAPLAYLSAPDLMSDLETCYTLLRRHLRAQRVWPFSYPGGKRDSFPVRALRKLRQLGFQCAFSTEREDNRRGVDPYLIGRTDGHAAAAPTTAKAAC